MIRVRQSAPTVIADSLPLPQNIVPEIPADVLARFPSLAGWYDRAKANERRLFSALQESNQQVSTATTKAKTRVDVLGVSITEDIEELEAADGFLSGKYTLTVIAGNVVTGMNLTSSTGTGTDISSVIFRATDFQIFNSVTGVAMFDVSGTDVRLAGTLTVSTSGKVYVGVGDWADANTAFYVDDDGFFSLKDKLYWNSLTEELVVDGTIISADGLIGGFTIGATDLSAGADATYVGLSSIGTTGLQIGSGTTNRALVKTNSSNLTGFLAANTLGAVIGSLTISDVDGHCALVVGGGVSFSAEGVVIDGSVSKITFGAVGSGDTNLYRSGANTLKTDDTLIAVVGLTSGAGSGATLAAGSVSVEKDVGFATGQGLVVGATRILALSATGISVTGTGSFTTGITLSNAAILKCLDSGATARGVLVWTAGNDLYLGDVDEAGSGNVYVESKTSLITHINNVTISTVSSTGLTVVGTTYSTNFDGPASIFTIKSGTKLKLGEAAVASADTPVVGYVPMIDSAGNPVHVAII